MIIFSPNTIIKSAESNANFEEALGMAGEIRMWGGATAPTGWILCQGQAISRVTYAILYAAIGTIFGAGNGSSTFNVPDLQDKFPIGKSGSVALGATGGEAAHQLSTTEIPNHSHAFAWQIYDYGNHNFSGTGLNPVVLDNTGASVSGTTGTGGDGAHNNIPPYQAVNFIIKV